MGRGLEIDLPYIHAYTDRNGHKRVYFRRKGFDKIKLPHPDSAGFLDAYKAALEQCVAAPKDTTAIVPGTFKALCHEYRSSADFRQLAESTKREMGYVIDGLCREHAGKRIAMLERRHILGWKDRMADTPGAANKMLRTIKRLLSFAVDRGYRKDNPALRIPMMRLGRYRSWTDQEMAAFVAHWPLGTLERTGFALAFYTGQRRGDLVKLKWTSIAGESLHLVQNKTGENMEIHIHRDLKKALAAVHPRHQAAILTGTHGKALSDVYFGHRMARAIATAGLPDACVLHGLRKTAARKVRESDGDVASVTGHRSSRLAAEYARDADQAKLNKRSVLKWQAKR